MSEDTAVSRLSLYVVDGSPPSCAVTMLGHILGLDIDYCDIIKTPELMKISPMHTIPILKDGDLTICESHAALVYLTTKYGGEKGEKLYPSDFATRAVVNHLMFWETGVLFVRLRVPARRIILDGLKAPSEKHKEDIIKAYGVLEANLKNRLYIATDHLTLADLSLGSTATAIQAIQKLDSDRFPLTAQWLERLHQEEFFKTINVKYALQFAERVNTSLEKNNK